MQNLKYISYLAIVIISGLAAFLFAKFLVPIVPVVFGIVAFYGNVKLRKATFGKSNNIYELTEGQVLLEGTVLKLEHELTSPYFKENCIAYLYKEIEYEPTDDGYYDRVLSTKFECTDFNLSTNTGIVKVKGQQLDIKQLKPRIYTEHSLKPQINDIGHSEYLLKANDKIVLIGTAVKNIYQRFEIAKLNNQPFYVTTRNKIESQKISHQVLLRLLPWMVVLYFVVNYFLFFAPSQNISKSDVFAYLSIFGLPILFVIFWLIGKDKKDFISQVFQYLAGVCILSSLLSFPLTILFYMIELEYYRMHCIFISIVSVTALALLFNYKKLVGYNTQSEKFEDKTGSPYDIEKTD